MVFVDVQYVSPLLPQKGDIEFVPLELFARAYHHLVKGSFQQMLSPDQHPIRNRTGLTIKDKGITAIVATAYISVEK